MTSIYRGKVLRTSLWFFSVLAIAMGVVIGINAVDEERSAELKALMVMPQPPVPNEQNGYVDSLGLGATGGSAYETGLKVLEALKATDQPGVVATPELRAQRELGTVKIDKKLLQCKPEERSCLEYAAGKPDLSKHLAEHDVLLKRYRLMRAKPDFIPLFYPTRLDSPVPAHSLQSTTALVLLFVANKINAGNIKDAVKELEQENAFHRKRAAAAVSIADKVASLVPLQRNALLIAELVRTKPQQVKPLLQRLEILMRPLNAAEADMEKVMHFEAGFWANVLPQLTAYPWDDVKWLRYVAPFFYRPVETANLYAAQSALHRKIANLPASEYYQARDEVKRQAIALIPQGPTNYFVNPFGRFNLELLTGEGAFDSSLYIGKVHDTQALFALVSLQLKLNAINATTPKAIAAALAGPLGATHPNPYSGQPMNYDPKTNSLGFESKNKSGFQAIKKRYGGRAAVAL
jgi:hypothetical protein